MDIFDQVVRVVTVIVLGASLYMAFRNFQFLQKSSEKSSLSQSLSAFNLHREELETVLRMDGVPFDRWEGPQSNAANVICFDLFHLGHLIQHGHVPLDFCELYYYTIPKCREILDPFIKDIRAKRHPEYWRKFDDLVVITDMYTRNHLSGRYHIQCTAPLLSSEEDIDDEITQRAKLAS